MSASRELTLEQKFQLYEKSVQEPEYDIGLYRKMFGELFGREFTALREDFCGTFLVSKYWVQQGEENTALAIDLDPTPLEYGKEHHWNTLSPSEQHRLHPLEGNSIAVTDSKHEVICCSNFSFYALKDRETLIEYFRCARESLTEPGMLVLEMVGGSGFVDAPHREKTVHKHEEGELAGKKWFTYTWRHHSFNPITREGVYSIDFSLANGKKFNDVFVYDWRVWTIPEVRECLAAAGFEESAVYWDNDDLEDEVEHEHQQYEQVEEAEDDDTWISYVVGVKR